MVLYLGYSVRINDVAEKCQNVPQASAYNSAKRKYRVVESAIWGGSLNELWGSVVCLQVVCTLLVPGCV